MTRRSLVGRWVEDGNANTHALSPDNRVQRTVRVPKRSALVKLRLASSSKQVAVREVISDKELCVLSASSHAVSWHAGSVAAAAGGDIFALNSSGSPTVAASRGSPVAAAVTAFPLRESRIPGT